MGKDEKRKFMPKYTTVVVDSSDTATCLSRTDPWWKHPRCLSVGATIACLGTITAAAHFASLSNTTAVNAGTPPSLALCDPPVAPCVGGAVLTSTPTTFNASHLELVENVRSQRDRRVESDTSHEAIDPSYWRGVSENPLRDVVPERMSSTWTRA